MRYPWANTALLVILLLQLVTGYLGFVNGEEAHAWLLWLHGAGAYALVLLLLWKGMIIWEVLARGGRWRLERIAFIVLTVMLLITLLLGILWTFGGLEYLFGFSLLSLHIYVAIPLIVLLAYHVWRRRWILRAPKATNRRAFLRLGLVAAGGAVLWWLAEQVNRVRRFTGSYEVGSFGGRFPRVSWINDDPAPIARAQWRLQIEGLVTRPLVLSYDQLRRRAAVSQTETVDCTGGWYSTQIWDGFSLAALLAEVQPSEDARSIRVESVTGYWRRFALEEIGDYLLATHVAERPLSHGHGFPLRLVAPNKRGFEWVKWITRITVEATPAYWQPPLPLQ